MNVVIIIISYSIPTIIITMNKIYFSNYSSVFVVSSVSSVFCFGSFGSLVSLPLPLPSLVAVLSNCRGSGNGSWGNTAAAHACLTTLLVFVSMDPCFDPECNNIPRKSLYVTDE